MIALQDSKIIDNLFNRFFHSTHVRQTDGVVTACRPTALASSALTVYVTVHLFTFCKNVFSGYEN